MKDDARIDNYYVLDSNYYIRYQNTDSFYRITYFKLDY